MVALLVAAGSSSLRHSKEEELFLLREQMQQLRQSNQTLEEKVRWVESEYARSLTLGKRLNEALLEEQERNRTLSERLQRVASR